MALHPGRQRSSATPIIAKGESTLCKIRVHLNRLNTALHLNRTHITEKASRKTCFFLSNPKDWYVITRRGYGIAVGVWHHAPTCISLRIDAIHHFVMIPSAPSSRFHTATSCGFHTRLRRDLDAESALKLWTDSDLRNA